MVLHEPSTTRFETFTSSANTTGQSNDIFTVDAGGGFDVDWIGIAIESGAGSDVSVRVFSGDSPVAPFDDAFDISGEFVRMPADIRLSPGDTLEARHDNDSNTARDVSVIVAGDEL